MGSKICNLKLQPQLPTKRSFLSLLYFFAFTAVAAAFFLSTSIRHMKFFFELRLGAPTVSLGQIGQVYFKQASFSAILIFPCFRSFFTLGMAQLGARDSLASTTQLVCGIDSSLLSILNFVQQRNSLLERTAFSNCRSFCSNQASAF